MLDRTLVFAAELATSQDLTSHTRSRHFTYPMPSNSKKRAREEAHPEPSNPNAKRKVALLVAYNGAPYQGLQKNPGATTIEETLEAAIHSAGGIRCGSDLMTP